MLSAVSNLRSVLAWNVSRLDGPFACAMCQGEAIVKKGAEVTHHFAHVATGDCEYGIGYESEGHRQAKKAIYEALLRNPKVTELRLERPMGSVRPDISFKVNGERVAIEVQISNLPVDLIIKRTCAYREKGIALLWISPFSTFSCEYDEQFAVRCSPKLWERFVHALYFGRAYYWTAEETLQPIHFGYYDIDGDTSKKFRTPVGWERVSITDLAKTERREQSVGKWTIPAALLWTKKDRFDYVESLGWEAQSKICQEISGRPSYAFVLACEQCEAVCSSSALCGCCTYRRYGPGINHRHGSLGTHSRACTTAEFQEYSARPKIALVPQ
jgi:hypothetical protein